MPERKNPWESRFHKVLLALLWVALALGVFVSFWEARSGSRSARGRWPSGADAIGAAMAAGVYVLGSQILPRAYLRTTWIRELSSLVGVTLVMMAVSLSGGLNSPFLLALSDTHHGGRRLRRFPQRVGNGRVGHRSAGDHLGRDRTSFTLPLFFQWAGLYLLIGFTFGQARRLLLEEGQRADALAAASVETTATPRTSRTGEHPAHPVHRDRRHGRIEPGDRRSCRHWRACRKSLPSMRPS